MSKRFSLNPLGSFLHGQNVPACTCPLLGEDCKQQSEHEKLKVDMTGANESKI